jgi:parallel beta-helix repeat protein
LNRIAFEITLILFLIGSLSLVFSVHPVRVGASLTIHNVNTGLNYSSIQEALDANETQNGDTIRVDSGTYVERVVVNKSVSLIGENQTNTIIDGPWMEEGIVVHMTATNAVMRGFTVQQSSTGSGNVWNAKAILIDYSSGCTIAENVVETNGIGIFLNQTSDCIVENNSVALQYPEGVGGCIWLVNSTNCQVTGNTVNTGMGIYLNYCSGCVVGHNRVDIITDSISVGACNYCRVEYNNLNKTRQSGHSILASDCLECSIVGNSMCNANEGMWVTNSFGCLFANNIMSSNRLSGFRLEYSNNSKISSNTVNNNGNFGIFLSQSPNSEVTYNTANGNGRNGIYYPSDSGISLKYSNACRVEGNIANGNVGGGISMSFCHQTSVVRYNEANDNVNGGIGLWNSEAFAVKYNVASNNGGAGITLIDTHAPRIESKDYYEVYQVGHNTVANNSYYGILLVDCSGHTIAENNATLNPTGIGIRNQTTCAVVSNYVSNNTVCGIQTYECADLFLWSNEASSDPCGLSIEDCQDILVTLSVVENNGIGISVKSSRNCTLDVNTAEKNLYGLELQTSSCLATNNKMDMNLVGILLDGDLNRLYGNWLFNNTKQVSNLWLNRTVGGYNTWDDGQGEGNYWDDYDSADTDGDRVGETPYAIDGKNIDFYPLIGAPSEDYRPPIISSCVVLNALPSASNIPKVNPLDVVKIQAQVIDQQTGVKKVTLCYGVGDLLNYSVGMVKTSGDGFNGTFEGWICPWIFLNGSSWNGGGTGVNITFRVEATDYPNNVGTSENMTFSTAEQRNTLDIDVTILKINTQDELSVDLNFELGGYLPAWLGDPIYLEADNWRENIRTDTAQLSMLPALMNGRSTLNYQGTLSQVFTLIGKSESYPFDSYYLNLTFRFHPSLPRCLSDQYWANVYSDAFGTLESNFYTWTNVTLSTKLPHYVLPGLNSTWGDPEANIKYVSGSYDEATGFNIDFVLERQLNNELPLLLLIVSVTYMLGATLLEDARWKPEVKTAVYLSFFVMVAGFNFALRYMIPFRYGLTVAEVLFITLTVATAIFSIGLIISNIMHERFSQKRARLANLIFDFSAVCISGILLAIFLVPALLLVIEVVGLSFGFIIRMAFINRSRVQAKD